MRIDAGVAHIQRAPSTTQGTARLPSTSATASASDASSSSTGPGVAQVDFTGMTRQDLFDWMNAHIKSGELSLGDSTGFLGMTLKMPVGGGAAALDDREPVNFMQLAQDGMDRARQHDDKATLQMLQTAMAIMQQHQGGALRVDVLA